MIIYSVKLLIEGDLSWRQDNKGKVKDSFSHSGRPSLLAIIQFNNSVLPSGLGSAIMAPI